MEDDIKVPEMKIDISNEVAEGIYSNLAVISHSPSEFVLDFARTLPNATPRVKSRIVMTPAHVKRLLIALSENITKYELDIQNEFYFMESLVLGKHYSLVP